MTPSFPPLLTGQPVPAGADPFLAAVKATADPGTVFWSEDAGTARAALVLAPEDPMPAAMAGVIAVALGLAEALGALGPPEMAVQYRWPGTLLINGGRCGGLRAAAGEDWLVVGLRVPALPLPQAEPGATPDETVLGEEGAGAITPPALIEAAARHSLVWINRYLSDGAAPLITAWQGLCIDATCAAVPLDPHGGQILQTEDGARTVPLTDMLETP
ncbi:biotin/lipoate--protein ligase family protein [Actibacterium sp. 188UL27-1]|uniref:biotin/lipoate--protein ligase family protein n=1 Tax=Actibacterium sp. 188UL27-1 TaxID=2786961 RepID=UPI00195B185D|nr:biotin/lipoate--protein ligase family protein [Actibacterium sp. 188UL27-1]MBM7066958.1 hypothetical protein [Actibacterium sp. 188UL27-1]